MKQIIFLIPIGQNGPFLVLKFLKDKLIRENLNTSLLQNLKSNKTVLQLKLNAFQSQV